MSSPESNRTLAFALLRLVVGVNLFVHGLVRFVTGWGAFVDGLEKSFLDTPLPLWMVRPMAWVIPPVELVLGALLIVGLRTREALAVSILLMAALTFGSGMQQNWGAAGTQLLYAFVLAWLLFHLEHDGWSIDSRRRS